MFSSKPSPFEEDIVKATHENNLTDDWALIMHVCDNAINYEGGAKLCLKAIMKRLYHNVPRVVLQALTLLDACVKNCDRRFLLQVASSEFTNEVQKLLPKMHPSAATKLKELLQRWSLEDFKDDPELCIIPSLYYKLKSEGVEFPSIENKKTSPALCTNPDGVSSQEEEEDIIKAIEISLKDTGKYVVPDICKNVQPVSSSQSEPIKVRALYDFDAAEDNELTIKAGEIVFVSDRCNQSWWKGSNHRGEGLFPSSFVTEDLDAIPEQLKLPETTAKAESTSAVVEESEVRVDEKKIEIVIDWLNDTDPTAEVSDPEEMLLLEKQCHKMAPIIEENLQAIDNRLAMLNVVNEKIMAAFDLFHSLSDSIPMSSHALSYPQNSILNQHIVQFPHPQVSALPPTAMLHQTMLPSVPHELRPVVTHPQNSYQVSPLQVQNTSTQETPKLPTISAANTMSSLADTDVKKPVQSQPPTTETIPLSTSTATLPGTLPNAVYNLSAMGGYCVPSTAIPYSVQCDPSSQHPGFQNMSSVGGVMTIPYPMRPYFPFQYYYVNSALPQTVVPAITSTDPAQTSNLKQAVPATTTEVSMYSAPTPVVSSYSSELNSLNLPPGSGDAQVEKENSQNENVPSDLSQNELSLKKNL